MLQTNWTILGMLFDITILESKSNEVEQQIDRQVNESSLLYPQYTQATLYGVQRKSGIQVQHCSQQSRTQTVQLEVASYISK